MSELGIALALASAIGANIAFLCKYRGANDAPAVRFSHPWASAAALFRARWWAIGFAIAAVAWGLHVAAIAIAPLSLVQAVTAGGLALLAIPAQLWFGIRMRRREWAGLGLSALGLAGLALTADASAVHSSYSIGGLVAFEAALIAAGGALLLSASRGHESEHSGVLLAVSAGLLVGVSNVAIKALSATVPGDILSLISPWTATAAAAGLVAFFALARGLQLGNAIQVIALSSIAANVTAIVGGVLVFGDSLGADVPGAIARSLALAAVVAAAAIIPAPRTPDARPA
jgi:drug/metabolite transporter (DMT)-like permease